MMGFPSSSNSSSCQLDPFPSISPASKVEEPWLNMAVLRYPANKKK